MRATFPDQSETAPRHARPARRLLLAVSACLLLLAAACDNPTTSSLPAPETETGQLPDLALLRLDGGLARLKDLHPGKVVVLNVWATWCPPCRAELPSLQRLSDGLDPDRFVVIGLSVDEDTDFVREFLHDIDITFPNYVAADGHAVTARLKIDSFPQTLLADPRGRVEARIAEPRDWAGAEPRAAVQALWGDEQRQVTAHQPRRVR